MTYKHLKSFLKTNISTYTDNFFDLIPENIKSKIIFSVGNRASEAGAFLCAIMSQAGISHSRYIDLPSLELKDRFIKNGASADPTELSELADIIIKKCKKNISPYELCILLALTSIADECEYLILEMSDSAFVHALSKSSIIPDSIMLTTLDDAITQIEASLIASPTAQIFTLSEQDDFDYISSKTTENGAKITYTSHNKTVKFRSDLFGTVFYYNLQEFAIRSFDLNNILPACLAIECARALFKAPLNILQSGLKNATLPQDIELYSLSPTVLLSERTDFCLDHGLKFLAVTEADTTIPPNENTIFCGSREFLDKIKNAVK